MTAEAFRAKRRQVFLTEHYFKLNIDHLLFLNQAHAEGIANLQMRGDLEPAGQGGIFRDKLNLLKLRYTAGCAVEELRSPFADVMKALGDWNDAYRVYIKSLDETGDELREDGTPLHFEDLGYFQTAMEIASLAVLLGDGDALRQIAIRLERYRGEDVLFEYLLSPAVRDPRDKADFFHVEPYDPLIDAFYSAKTPEESSAFVRRYLEGWYKSFEAVPWHNGHLVTTDRYMFYYGYWSFEAAAVCVIHGIDDSSFRDHMVYPKDLADWARANQSVARLKPPARAPILVKTGEAAPHSGIYAAHDGLARELDLNQGDIVPEAEDLMDPKRPKRAFTWILRQRRDGGPISL